MFGFEPGGLSNLVWLVLISVVWLYGTLVLAERQIGVHHHASRVAPFDVRPLHPHEREGCRRRQQTRRYQRTLLFRLDAARDRRARTVLRHPLSARTVEPAMAPVTINPGETLALVASLAAILFIRPSLADSFPRRRRSGGKEGGSR